MFSYGNGRVVEKRVVDHYVFERKTPPVGPWQIKERVETTLPAFLVPKSAEDKGALQLAKNNR